jgi:hypothetical protein
MHPTSKNSEKEKNTRRSPFYFNLRNNKVVPRPVLTCIDEVYASGPVSYPPSEQKHLTSFSSSQKSKDDSTTKTGNWRQWLLTIIIIVIIICIITIVVLLAVFLTRSN